MFRVKRKLLEKGFYWFLKDFELLIVVCCNESYQEIPMTCFYLKVNNIQMTEQFTFSTRSWHF